MLTLDPTFGLAFSCTGVSSYVWAISAIGRGIPDNTYGRCLQTVTLPSSIDSARLTYLKQYISDNTLQNP